MCHTCNGNSFKETVLKECGKLVLTYLIGRRSGYKKGYENGYDKGARDGLGDTINYRKFWKVVNGEKCRLKDFSFNRDDFAEFMERKNNGMNISEDSLVYLMVEKR